jgi:hypothetical protein
MTEKLTVKDIDEKARDLVATLRQVEGDKPAAVIEKLIREFKSPTAFRRAISDLQRQLEEWRENPRGFPDTVRARFEAQQLEDACRLILGIGTGKGPAEDLEPLPLTLLDHLRRLLRLAAITAVLGSLVFAVPVALQELGIDWINLKIIYETETVELARGREARVPISVLAASQMPRKTSMVKIFPRDWCKGAVFRDLLTFSQWICENSERMLAADGSPTYEMKRTGQYHGLLFAIIDTGLVGSVGSGTVQLFATEETTTGLYKLPLQAAYRGYRPANCWGFGVLRSCGEPTADEEAEHSGLRVPTLVVNVVDAPVSEAGEVKTSVEEQEAREKRLREERELERMKELQKQLRRDIASALKAVGQARKSVARREWIEVRDALQKLAKTHDELNERVRTSADPGIFRESMVELREKMDRERSALSSFETRVFDSVFEALHRSGVPEQEVELAKERVARQYRIPVDYVDSIYQGRIGEARARLKKLQEARLARDHEAWVQAQRRCGESPQRAAEAVESYLRAMLDDPNLSVVECQTPRFQEKDCWMVACEFLGEDASGMRKKFRWRFFMEQGRVKRHGL